MEKVTLLSNISWEFVFLGGAIRSGSPPGHTVLEDTYIFIYRSVHGVKIK